MSTHSGLSPTAPTSAVRNMVGREKEMTQVNLNGTATDAALREYCDKHYNQLLQILVEKMHQEKVQQEKLKAVKARLNFEEVSQHSESGTPSRKKDLRKRLRSRRISSVSESPELKRGRSESPRKRDPKRKTVFKRLEKGVFHMLGDKGKKEHNLLLRNIITKDHPHAGRKQCQKVKVVEEDIGNQGQKSKDQALRMAIYPSHSYDDLKEAFLANFRQQKICIKDPVEIHHIKQREGESMKDFVRRFKIESRDVKGAPKVIRISGFMHGITNPELIKRLHDKIPRSVDEMMRITTSFLRGEVAAEELLKNGKLSLVIKELKQNSGKDQPKTNKKGKTSNKDNALAILMVQQWQMVARQRITQSFFLDPKILFPPLEEEGTEGPMITEAEIRAYEHDWGPKAYSKTSVKRTGGIPSSQANEERLSNKQEPVNTRKVEKLVDAGIMKEDVQKLNGKPVSLNRFLAKSAEKSLPFFKNLKRCTKKSDFYWTEEAESAF
nr:reverse transcriptase domain-containing protein [Tanacetum cinerariifolium]